MSKKERLNSILPIIILFFMFFTRVILNYYPTEESININKYELGSYLAVMVFEIFAFCFNNKWSPIRELIIDPLKFLYCWFKRLIFKPKVSM